MPRIALHELEDLVAAGLARAGAGEIMARTTATALVAAEAEGMSSHGLFRAAQYAGHLRSGRVDGAAEPRVVAQKPAACLVDAGDGLAFPACTLAVHEAIGRARVCGAAFAGVTRSHHFGVAAWHLAPVAEAGLVGLAFGNSPAAMPAWGGKRAIFGTNPVAAIFPRRDAAPLVIDLSLSEVARGKLMVAAREGKPIPAGWAVDRDGKPTIDAKAALDGMMLPAGGVKGAMRPDGWRPQRLQAAKARTAIPSPSSSRRSGALTSSVAPSAIPTSMKGSRRSSSRRSIEPKLRPTISSPANRSSTTIIGTTLVSGSRCTSKGTEVIDAPNPVVPTTV